MRTVELEVVVHDEAAGEPERHVVLVLERHQERVVQVLRSAGRRGVRQSSIRSAVQRWLRCVCVGGVPGQEQGALGKVS